MKGLPLEMADSESMIASKALRHLERDLSSFPLIEDVPLRVEGYPMQV